MERIERSTRGLTLLVDLNWDRLMFAGAIVAALGLSTLLSALLH